MPDFLPSAVYLFFLANSFPSVLYFLLLLTAKLSSIFAAHAPIAGLHAVGLVAAQLAATVTGKLAAVVSVIVWTIFHGGELKPKKLSALFSRPMWTNYLPSIRCSPYCSRCFRRTQTLRRSRSHSNCAVGQICNVT